MTTESTPAVVEEPVATPAAATEVLPVVTPPAESGTAATATSTAATDKPDAPAPDELTMLNALKQVVDPELFVNVVDLGLIYAIQETEGKVAVDMTLTSPACPAGPQLIQQSKMALENLPGVKEANIKLVMSPPWTPDRMTDEARDQLGIF